MDYIVQQTHVGGLLDAVVARISKQAHAEETNMDNFAL